MALLKLHCAQAELGSYSGLHYHVVSAVILTFPVLQCPTLIRIPPHPEYS